MTYYPIIISFEDLLNMDTNILNPVDDNLTLAEYPDALEAERELFIIKYEGIDYIVSQNKNLLSYLSIMSKNRHKVPYSVLQSSCECYIIEYNQISSFISFEELCGRYNWRLESLMSNNIKIENIKDENSSYSDNDLYKITSWGADLSFRELTNMYNDGDLLKPELQRKYVWTKTEASRFIDSILLGLPVPSIFLAKESNETLLIVDGFQRIMTVNDFMRGIFSGDNKVFKLSNSEAINEKWRGKAYSELPLYEQRKLRNTTIHAIIFEQQYPDNNTGMYQIFERINTAGKTLKPQEIRNCVYQGNFNDLLFDLNKNEHWRTILDSHDEDSRMADLELILRFFAIKDLHNRPERKQKRINLTKYLNVYMGDNKNITVKEYQQNKSLFENVADVLFTELGHNSFRNLKSQDTTEFTKKINPAIFDALSVATAYAIKKGHYNNVKKGSMLTRYIQLLSDNRFIEAIKTRTTDTNNINTRIQLACMYLYGVDYE